MFSYKNILVFANDNIQFIAKRERECVYVRGGKNGVTRDIQSFL